MTPKQALRALILVCSFTVPAVAQDLITVSWIGPIMALDSTTGSMATIAPGYPHQRGLARDGMGELWATAPIAGQSRLVHVDPGDGSTTLTATLPFYPQSLATAGGTGLFAAAASTLLYIDTATGATTTIGSTGLSALGAIVTYQGVLYGWDRVAGLVLLDPVTGLATDVNPAIGGATLATGGIDWLAVRDDGVMVGGGGGLRFSFDLATGIAQFLGLMAFDIRGAAPGVATAYGVGCHGGAGRVELRTSGNLRSPSLLTSTSIGHGSAGAAQHPGVLVFGWSRTSHGGNSLPFDLDPLLGTQGCSLLASIDASMLGLTGNGALQFVLSMPAGLAGATFHLQHAVFEPVAGNMSWSQGVRVRLGS